MDKKELVLKVGEYCKDFRLNTLKLTLTEFSTLTKLNLKNVSAFEHGNANSIEYLYHYYNMCGEGLKKEFSKGLFNIYIVK